MGMALRRTLNRSGRAGVEQPMHQNPYAQNAGYVSADRTRTGGWAVVYIAAEQGVEQPQKYLTVCEEHSTNVASATLAGARGAMRNTSQFCDECRGKTPR